MGSVYPPETVHCVSELWHKLQCDLMNPGLTLQVQVFPQMIRLWGYLKPQDSGTRHGYGFAAQSRVGGEGLGVLAVCVRAPCSVEFTKP